MGMHLNKEPCINFPSTQYIARFAWHAPSMIFTHPLQIVWIVSASFKFASVPRPKPFALSAEHLVTPFGFVNRNFAIWAWFCVVLKEKDGSDSVGIADMERIIAISLEFPAMSTSVFLTCATFPSGRDETVAVGISTPMNELIGCIIGDSGRIMTLQLSLGLNEIVFVGDEGFDLCIDRLELIVNVLDELVMRDSGLSGRKHGLFLGEENVLLTLGELSSEEGLGKAEMLKLRMGELRVAKEALGDRNIIPTEESLVTGSAGGLGTGIKRASDGFAIGGI